LTELNIATNALTSLPVEIGLLTILSRLDMSNNDITVPPVEVVMRGPADVVDFMRRICDAKYSGILNLSGKSLKLVNPEIFRIEGLRVLNMSDNLLTEIPNSFENMTLLTELAVANNQLSTLPPSLASCEALERLDISGNRMQSLPCEIGALSRVAHFSFVQAASVNLISPPEAIIGRGMEAIMDFLASIYFAQRTISTQFHPKSAR
jgi:leucine-rich repeat protein SHOC2